MNLWRVAIGEYRTSAWRAGAGDPAVEQVQYVALRATAAIDMAKALTVKNVWKLIRSSAGPVTARPWLTQGLKRYAFSRGAG
jgi:hypothetical protein